jgi:hypothetical protein
MADDQRPHDGFYIQLGDLKAGAFGKFATLILVGLITGLIIARHYGWI